MSKLFNSFAAASEEINKVSDALNLPPEERNDRGGEVAVSAIDRAIAPGVRIRSDVYPNVQRGTRLGTSVEFAPNSRPGTRAPEPVFDEGGMGMRLGTLSVAGVKADALRVDSRSFVVDRKPPAWELFASLYDVKIYDANEWESRRTQQYPGWRSRSNRIFNAVQDTIQSGERYSFQKRI